jgi:cyanophycinase
MKLKFILFFVILSISFTDIHAQENPFFNYKGKLIIVGGGTMPDSLFTFFANFCGGKDQPIVYIPTATSDEKYIQEGGHLLKFTTRGFTNVSTIHTRDKVIADDPKNIELIKNAKGIFFGGGDQDLIAAAYGGTRLYTEFLNLLERGGVIMGTSAGATIMGSLLVGGDARKDLTKPFPFQPAFSFVKNMAIDQHVLARNRQFDLIPVIEKYQNQIGVAIDESTAIIVEAGQFRVWGLSYALIYDPLDWEEQKKQWGKVIKPFKMIGSGGGYQFVSRKILK